MGLQWFFRDLILISIISQTDDCLSSPFLCWWRSFNTIGLYQHVLISKLLNAYNACCLPKTNGSTILQELLCNCGDDQLRDCGIRINIRIIMKADSTNWGNVVQKGFDQESGPPVRLTYQLGNSYSIQVPRGWGMRMSWRWCGRSSSTSYLCLPPNHSSLLTWVKINIIRQQQHRSRGVQTSRSGEVGPPHNSHAQYNNRYLGCNSIEA
jgi:hypothetical protein